LLKKVKHYSIITLGQLISAIAFSVVLLPNNLIAGGFGGLATVINKMTGTNIQLLLICFCTPILIWAFTKYSKKLVFYATLCFGLFTFFIGIVGNFISEFKTDSIIASIVGGVLMGISAGIIIREGAANGPEAIVALYLKENKGITVGTFFMILNFSIVFSSIIYGDITLIIYSLISIYISSKVTDYIILGTRRDYSVNIISENFLDITEFIHKQLKRGVTFVPCVGTYKISKKMMIKTVVTSPELIELKKYVAQLEDNTFIYVTESIEVIGGGFTD